MDGTGSKPVESVILTQVDDTISTNLQRYGSRWALQRCALRRVAGRNRQLGG
jgi:hypothetical protein